MPRRVIRRFNRRILNPAMLVFAGRRLSPYAAVRHVGRRTGRAYATPVVAKPAGDGFVIPLPYGERVDWLRNVKAQGGCTIVQGGKAHEVTDPQVIDQSAALPVFPLVQRLLFRLFGIDRFLTVKNAAAASAEPADQSE